MSAANEAPRNVPRSAPHPETPWQAHPPVAVPFRPWLAGLRAARSEVRTALRLVLVLGASGLPLGLLWLVLAPRREYEVVEGGFQAIEPQSEALIGADAWLTILTAVLGVLGAGLVWRIVGARGVSIVVGLAAGMMLASVVAWQIGEWLGSGPTEAQTSQLGTIVAPALQLRAIPVLVIGAFLATLTYLIVVCFAPSDDLQRSPTLPVNSGWMEPPTAPGGPVQLAARQGPSAPYATDATALQAGQPSGLRPGVPGDPRP